MFKLEANKLNEFLTTLSQGRKVLALEPLRVAEQAERPAIHAGEQPAPPSEDQYHLERASAWDPARHTLGEYRPVEPLKSLLFPPREFLGNLKQPVSPITPPQIAIGVKNCDLSALKIHDYVNLKNDPIDPSYQQARQQTAIVASDCTNACAVCFCPAVGEQPYAKEGFDINLSPTRLGIVVETGSPLGEQLLKRAEHLLLPADAGILAERENLRQAITRKVCEQTERMGLHCGSDLKKAIENSREKEIWDDFAFDCVECGACNFICCTCHCFLLAHGQDKHGGCARAKQWDACLFLNFAAVAGGGNPRKHRAERLFNRFEKKFSFFPDVLGIYACDGCGRCVEACAGRIDIREVLKRAVNEL